MISRKVEATLGRLDLEDSIKEFGGHSSSGPGDHFKVLLPPSP